MEFKIRIHADGTAELVNELGRVQGGFKTVGESATHAAREAVPALDAQRRAVEQVAHETDAASQSAGGFVERLKSMRSVLGVLGVSLSAAGFMSWVRSTADAADALDKLSQRVGVATGELQRLQFAASQSGVANAQLEQGLTMLARSMADATSGTGEAAAAFQRLGVSVTDSDGRLKASDQVLQELAGQFARFEDGAAKAALAQRLFGRAGADMIPLLNQGSAGIARLGDEAERAGLVMSEQLIKKSVEFNDNLDLLKRSSGALARELAGPVVTALANVTTRFLDARRAGEGFLASLGAAMFKPAERSALDKVVETMQLVNAELQKLPESDPRFAAYRAALTRQLELITQDFERLSAEAVGAASSVNALGEGLSELLDMPVGGPDGGPAKAADEYARLIASIQDKINAQQLEAAGITNVTAAQAEAYKLMTALRDGTLALTDAQKAGLALRLQELLALEESNRATREAAELQKAYAANVAAALQPLEARARAARLEVQQFGLTERQIEKNTLARIEEALVIARANGLIPEHIAFLEREIAARRELVAAMDDLEGLERNAAAAAEVARAWEEAGKRIDEVFANAWKGAFSSFKDFASGLKNAFWSMLGELGHMALSRPILVQMGVLGGGAGAAGRALAGQAGGVGGGFNPLTMLSGNGIGMGMSNVMTSLATSPMLAGTGAGNWLMGAAGNAAGMSNLALGGAGILGGLGAHLLFDGKGHSGTLGGLGSTIGMAVAGPLGAIVGSVLGGAVGSLFGENTPTNYWQQTTRDVQTGVVLSQTNNPGSRRHSPENLAASDALTLAAVGAAQALHAITGEWAAESIKIGVGNRDKQLSIDGVGIFSPGSDRLDRYSNDQVLDLAIVTLVERSDELSETFRTLALAVEGGAEKVRMLGGLAAIAELQGRSPTQAAADDLAAARSATDIYREQTAEVQRLVDAYDGSVDATVAVAEAWALQQEMAYQLAAALMQTATAAQALLGTLAHHIRESLMGEEELYNHRKAQVDGLVEALSTMTDPGEIFATVQQIERLTGQMWASLSKEQQQAMGKGFLDFLEGVDALVTDVIGRALDGLDTDQASISQGLDDAMSRAAADLTAAAETTREAAGTMREAATTMASAAAAMQTAANTPVKVQVEQVVKHITTYVQQPAAEVGGGY